MCVRADMSLDMEYRREEMNTFGIGARSVPDGRAMFSILFGQKNSHRTLNCAANALRSHSTADLQNSTANQFARLPQSVCCR